MKKIISSVLAGAMLLSSVPVMASDINITINNEVFIPKSATGKVVEPFIENGSTFLPVRAMGEAVGKEVAFDADNYAVYIGLRPTEEEVKSYPYVMMDDIIFSENFAYDLGYRAADFFDAYKLIKYAEAKIADGTISKETVDKKTMEIFGEVSVEEYAEYFGIPVSDAKLFLKIAVYELCLFDLISVEGMDFSDYVTVKHILTTDEVKANEIIQKLNGGESFDNLIEEYNEDPGQTKESSYTFTYGEMVEPFEKAAFALGENEYTKEPVVSDFGYHIIVKLPLNKEEVDTTDYKAQKLYEMVGTLPDPEKTVYLTKEGDAFGQIDGMDITDAEFEFLGTADYYNYPETFDTLLEVLGIVYACENGLLSEMELEAARAVEFETEGLTVSEEFARKIYEGINMTTILNEKIAKDESFYDELVTALTKAYEKLMPRIYRDLRLYVDGKLIVPCDVKNNYVEPHNINGTVYVPVRAIVEALGMKADWDNDTRTVMITK